MLRSGGKGEPHDRTRTPTAQRMTSSRERCTGRQNVVNDHDCSREWSSGVELHSPTPLLTSSPGLMQTGPTIKESTNRATTV